MVCTHLCANAIYLMLPLFECNNNGHELTVLHGVVLLNASEFLAKISYSLQTTTLILLYRATNAICRSISVYGEVRTHVRDDQNRSSGECHAKGLKGLLLGGTPLPQHT